MMGQVYVIWIPLMSTFDHITLTQFLYQSCTPDIENYCSPYLVDLQQPCIDDGRLDHCMYLFLFFFDVIEYR